MLSQNPFQNLSVGDKAVSFHQLKEALNATGESLVFILNNLLKDCKCRNPSS